MERRISRQFLIRPLLLAGVIGAVSACGGGGSTPSSTTSSASSSVPRYNPIYGVTYAPYTDGRQPPAPISESLARRYLGILQGRTEWVRIVGLSTGQKDLPRIAHDMGFKVAATAWINADPAQNQQEIAALEQDVKAGNAQLAIVGSEAIHDHTRTTPQMVALLDQVRSDISGKVPVATVEPDRETLANQQLIAHEDELMVNVPPISYADVVGGLSGTAAVDKALAYVKSEYAKLQQAGGGKPVAIGETEWATAGFPVTTPENGARYFTGIQDWARPNKVPVFYFEAFDEPWLGKFNAVGPHWGIFNADGSMKPGFEAAFALP